MTENTTPSGATAAPRAHPEPATPGAPTTPRPRTLTPSEARTDPRRTLGALGERHVCAYLVSLGYEILATNWRCHEGEIDVVALDGREIVVIEVKTRRSQRFGPAVEAVTHEKHLRLRRLAFLWLREHEVSAPVRIDVIGVDVLPDGIRVDHRPRVIL